MRYVRLKLTPEDGAGFHPLGRELSAEPEVTRGPIHRVDILADGTGVLLAEAWGDREHYEAILEASPYVYDYAVTGAEGRWYSYTHFEPTTHTHEMMDRRSETELMMEMPIEVHTDGSFEVTLVGDEEAFAEAGSPAMDEWDAEILEVGDRRPEPAAVLTSLTERQREVLETAVKLGYYESPREATHADVADALDSTPSTVGEHLQKIESTVFSALVK